MRPEILRGTFRRICRTYSPEGWCLRPESNQRHGDFQSPALPTELQRQMATRKGLEPSTSGVTGRRSNQLNYRAICALPAELCSRDQVCLGFALVLLGSSSEGYYTRRTPTCQPFLRNFFRYFSPPPKTPRGRRFYVISPGMPAGFPGPLWSIDRPCHRTGRSAPPCPAPGSGPPAPGGPY